MAARVAALVVAMVEAAMVGVDLAAAWAKAAMEAWAAALVGREAMVVVERVVVVMAAAGEAVGILAGLLDSAEVDMGMAAAVEMAQVTAAAMAAVETVAAKEVVVMVVVARAVGMEVVAWALETVVVRMGARKVAALEVNKAAEAGSSAAEGSVGYRGMVVEVATAREDWGAEEKRREGPRRGAEQYQSRARPRSPHACTSLGMWHHLDSRGTASYKRSGTIPGQC